MNIWLAFYALNTTHEKPSQQIAIPTTYETIRWGIRLNQKSKIKDENVHMQSFVKKNFFSKSIINKLIIFI